MASSNIPKNANLLKGKGAADFKILSKIGNSAIDATIVHFLLHSYIYVCYVRGFFFSPVNKFLRIYKFIAVKLPNGLLIVTFSSNHLFGHRLSQLQSFTTGYTVLLHVVSAAFSLIQTCFSSTDDNGIFPHTHSLPITYTSCFTWVRSFHMPRCSLSFIC